METKHQVHNLIILDESGSMASIKQTTIQGFNEIVQTLKGMQIEHPDQEHFISLISFNGIRQNLVHFIDPVSKLEQIDSSKYNPDASTPLFDAIGAGINKLKQVIGDRANYNVLVTILTDGEENASREYSGQSIKKLIEELKLKRWTFTYIGTDHDVEKMAASISIDNTMKFDKNEAEMKRMFEDEKNARYMYYKKISMNEDTNSRFYEKPKSKEERKDDSATQETERSLWGKLFGEK